MRRFFAMSLSALVLAAPVAHAGIEKAGTTAASFLSVGAGADVLGMGGATLGFGSGLGAGAWNIAALSGLQYPEYVFSHASLTGESPQDWIAAGGRFGASRTRWGLTGLYQGDGAFEGRDASNNVTGSFNASSMAVGFQVAQGLGNAALGFGVKYASEKLGDVTGGGVTFDAGLRLQAGPLGFGAAAQNAFGKMSYSGTTYDFPTNYGAGVAYTIPASGLTLAVDANFPNAYYSDVRGGVEWRYRDRIALRTGYRKELNATDGEPLGGPSFGVGAGANGFWLDYGFLTGGASGSGQHRVALTYRPGFLNGETHDAAVVTAPEPRKVERSAAPKPVRIEPVKAEKLPEPKVEKRAAPAIVKETPKAAAPVVEAPKPAPPSAPAVSETTKPEATKPTTAPAKAAARATPAVVAPPRVEKPVSAPAKTAPQPAAVAPKTEKPAAPKAETVRAEAPKLEAPKSEAPKTQTVKPEPAAPAKVEAPAKSEAPAEAPKAAPAETPKPAPPTEVAKPETPPAPAKAREEARPAKVKVKSGETLADIARRWGCSVASIMMDNNLVSESVKSGQTLKLPARGR